MLTTSGDWRTPICWHARMSNQAEQKNAGRACFVNFAAVPQPPNRSRFNLKPRNWLRSFAIFLAFPCDLCGLKPFRESFPKHSQRSRSLSTSQDFATRLPLWLGHSCLRLGWRETAFWCDHFSISGMDGPRHPCSSMLSYFYELSS
jgi:hypothetical protein